MRRGSNLDFSGNVGILKEDGVSIYRNKMLRDGILMIGEFFMGEPTETINYLAVGDNGSDNRMGMVALENEVFRKEITTKYLDGESPVWETFFTQDEANFQWKELGLYADGSEDPDSGRLVARVVVDEDKNDNITLTTLWRFDFANRIGG